MRKACLDAAAGLPVFAGLVGGIILAAKDPSLGWLAFIAFVVGAVWTAQALRALSQLESNNRT